MWICGPHRTRPDRSQAATGTTGTTGTTDHRQPGRDAETDRAAAPQFNQGTQGPATRGPVNQGRKPRRTDHTRTIGRPALRPCKGCKGCLHPLIYSHTPRPSHPQTLTPSAPHILIYSYTLTPLHPQTVQALHRGRYDIRSGPTGAKNALYRYISIPLETRIK